MGSCTVGGAAQGHHRDAFQLGGGGELVGFQHAHAGVEAINTALEDGEFLLELGHELLELIGGFGNAIEASVEKGSCFETGHRLATLEGAVGITSDAAVALDQVGECLVSPVGGLHISELADAGDLLISGVLADAVDVEVGSGSGHRSQQAQGSRRNQQLLKEFHGCSSHEKAQCAVLIMPW